MMATRKQLEEKLAELVKEVREGDKTFEELAQVFDAISERVSALKAHADEADAAHEKHSSALMQRIGLLVAEKERAEQERDAARAALRELWCAIPIGDAKTQRLREALYAADALLKERKGCGKQ